MAMLKKVTLYFAHLDKPHKPPFGGKDAIKLRWDVQIRTSDPAQRKEWLDMGIVAKLMKEPEMMRDPEDPKGQKIDNPNAGENILDADGNKQWKYSLTRFLHKKDGSENEPPKVQDGGLDDIDPSTVGDGSIANISIFQYDNVNKDGTPGKGTIMKNLQIIKLVKRKPFEGSSEDEFETTETEVVEEEDDGEDETPVVASKPAKSTPKPPGKSAPKPPTKPSKDIY